LNQTIIYRISPPVTSEQLNELFAASWLEGEKGDFGPVLERSLAYVCAYLDGELVGFVNVAWNGGSHAFLLDTTVHPDLRRRGVGTELVRRAEEASRERGAEWLHVDYDPHLESFYRRCGFRHTEAGLIRLDSAR
jgi:GNAT superfamily N-acetyltransferase